MDKIRKKRGLQIFFIITVSLSMVGCAIRRKTDSTVHLDKMPVFRVENATVELNDLTQAFWGLSEEEAEEYVTFYSGVYEMDGLQLTPVLDNSDGNVWAISYFNGNEGAEGSYTTLIYSTFSSAMEDKKLRQIFPNESLDTCSKEEAIEACRPYAEACGYADAEVSVYALTFDIIDYYSRLHFPGEEEKVINFAPDPEYQVVTYREIREIEAQLSTLKEGSDEYKELSENVEEMYSTKSYGASRSGIPWEKKHEAFILTYQPYIEGYPTEENFNSLFIIYAPLYDGPVYLQTLYRYQMTDIIEETDIISSEEAIAEVLLTEGYEPEEIDVQKISLVYAPQLVFPAEGESWTKMIPCWSIEYIADGKPEENIIDAQYGTVYQYIPQH